MPLILRIQYIFKYAFSTSVMLCFYTDQFWSLKVISSFFGPFWTKAVTGDFWLVKLQFSLWSKNERTQHRYLVPSWSFTRWTQKVSLASGYLAHLCTEVVPIFATDSVRSIFLESLNERDRARQRDRERQGERETDCMPGDNGWNRALEKLWHGIISVCR